MDLYLRKVVHPQAHDNYRVILKLDEGEFEIGSIGIQHGGVWALGIDTVIPMRAYEAQGAGRDRRDCMRQFKAAWERFAADEANLTEFLNAKRTRRLMGSEVDAKFLAGFSEGRDLVRLVHERGNLFQRPTVLRVALVDGAQIGW